MSDPLVIPITDDPRETVRKLCVRVDGLTILLDSRNCSAQTAIYWAKQFLDEKQRVFNDTWGDLWFEAYLIICSSNEISEVDYSVFQHDGVEWLRIVGDGDLTEEYQKCSGGQP